MHPDSPHYLFHPESIGSLKRRAEGGEQVLPADLATLVAADPSVVPDTTLRRCLVRACRGDLHARRGRPKRSALAKIRTERAAHQVDVLVRWYKRAKRRGYSYAYDRAQHPGLSLTDHVHELVARRLKLGAGRSLGNEIRAHKNCPF